jgi:hypothetical protein
MVGFKIALAGLPGGGEETALKTAHCDWMKIICESF